MSLVIRQIALRLVALATLTAAALAAGPATAQIRITEVMSSSGVGGTADWFEVTNYGASLVTSTGWRMDDSSFSFANSVELFGVTTIAAGESVLFIESAAGADIPAFQTFWGPSLGSTQIGYYSGSGVGFSSNGDGVVVFDTVGAEITPQTSFPAATAGSSFYWGYDAAGDFVYGSASSGVVSTAGTLDGQVTFLSATSSPENIGSPGTAALVPEPSSVVLVTFAGLGLAGYAARRRLPRKTATIG